MKYFQLHVIMRRSNHGSNNDNKKKDLNSIWIFFTALKHLKDCSSPKWFENAVSIFFSQLRREIEWKGREASLGEVTQKTWVRLRIDENALLVVKLSSHIDRKKNGGASGISNWPSADCSIDDGLASCGSNYLWRIFLCRVFWLVDVCDNIVVCRDPPCEVVPRAGIMTRLISSVAASCKIGSLSKKSKKTNSEQKKRISCEIRFCFLISILIYSLQHHLLFCYNSLYSFKGEKN